MPITRLSTMLLGSVVCAIALASRAQTAPTMVDNPVYTHWAKFKVGSNHTTTMSTLGAGGVMISRTIVSTLKEVTADAVTVDSRRSDDGVEVDDVKTSKIPAKVEPESAMPGDPDTVTAMSRKFECTSYQLRADTFGDAKNFPGTATEYFSDDVPGGMVKLVLRVGDKELTAELIGFEAK